MRLLILAVLIYVLYRLFKKVLQPPSVGRPTQDVPPAGKVDEMVQDPFCSTYVPLRDAVKRTIKGKDYYFCSEDCADQFEEQTGGSGDKSVT